MYEFQKMHGLGNHFLFFDELHQDYGRLKKAEIIRKLCDVKFGIGGDGVVFIMDPKSPGSHCRMQMFNIDGSEAEMCGNAIRGVAHRYKKHNQGHDPILIETKGGIREVRANDAKDGVCYYTVDMGKAVFDLTATGDLLSPTERKPLHWREETLEPLYVHVGNPHAVLFLKSPLNSDEMLALGAWMETHPNHPSRINVEMVEICSPGEVKVTVWERGCGMTFACGTGATAVAGAGIKSGQLQSPVTVHMPGGDLVISLAENGHLFMTGPVQEVVEGKLSPSFVDSLLAS
jgi:diaminopimelate epimerase